MIWKELQNLIENMGVTDNTEIWVRTYDGFYDELDEENIYWTRENNNSVIQIG